MERFGDYLRGSYSFPPTTLFPTRHERTQVLYIIITRKIRATTFPSYARNWRSRFGDNRGARLWGQPTSGWASVCLRVLVRNSTFLRISPYARDLGGAVGGCKATRGWYRVLQLEWVLNLRIRLTPRRSRKGRRVIRGALGTFRGLSTRVLDAG